jgi:Putative 8-oxoguanine DNA glycosylase OGG-like protein
MTAVPEAVLELLGTWQPRGRPGQAGINWPRARWQERFPECEDLFACLPDRLDREHVRVACAGAASTPAAAWQGFMVVMVWGYGRVGYGPWRTARIRSDTPKVQDRLARVAQHLAERGAVDAYRLLAGDCRLRWLGPAFGTKYLYFCPQRPESQALILDRLVARWLTNQANISVNAGPWSPTTYRRYLDLLGGWAATLSVAADDLERCIFQAQADQQASQWAGPPTAAGIRA